MVTPAPIELSSLGMADSLILMVLALVVFGPRRLPQIGRQIGKLMYEFRKASNDFKFQMEEELRLAEESDRRKKEEAERQQAALAAPAQTLEAQADIGAVEPPLSSPYPEEIAAEEAAHEPEPEQDAVVHLPRVAAPIIQPPSSGAPVPATRPNAIASATQETAAEIAPETGAETEAPAESAHPLHQQVPTEPANQNG